MMRLKYPRIQSIQFELSTFPPRWTSAQPKPKLAIILKLQSWIKKICVARVGKRENETIDRGGEQQKIGTVPCVPAYGLSASAGGRWLRRRTGDLEPCCTEPYHDPGEEVQGMVIPLVETRVSSRFIYKS